MNVKVKICGITSREDALAAAAAGADALGFIFYEKSPRYLAPAEAGEIIRQLPPLISTVGVFVNASRETIAKAARESGVTVIQLHGDEPPAFCAGWPLRVIKAFRVKGRETLESMQSYPVSAWLLDAYAPGQMGGTGEQFDWELAREAATLFPRVVLAGGLTPANVAEAVRRVRPYGVDVSSGVEFAPGRKNLDKVREFVVQARQPGRETT